MRRTLRAHALDPEKRLEEILTLHNAMDASTIDGGTATKEIFRATHLRPGRGGRILVFGAEDDEDRLTGFTVVEAHPGRGHGFRLVAGENARARGAAFDAALAQAREAGTPRMRAWMRTPDARMLLQAYGFHVTGLVTEMARPLDGDLRAPDPRVHVEPLSAEALRDATDLVNAAYARKWPTHDAWAPQDLAEWATAPGARFLGARLEGPLVGVCGIRPRATLPSAWEIGRFAVHPDAQGRGVGRSLLRAALKHLAEENQAGLARLSVYEGNPAALQLYRSEGFTDTGLSWVLTVSPQW